MNASQLTNAYKSLCTQFSEGLAADMLLEKYPDQEELIEQVVGRATPVLPAIVATTDEEVEIDEGNPEAAAKAFDILAQSAQGVNTVPELVKPAKKRAVKQAKAEKAPAEVKEKKVSKASQAYEIYVNATDRSRAVITKKFMEELGLTAAGSSTYAQNCKKKFESAQS